MHESFRWGNGGRRLHGRPRKRWDDNIKMSIQEICWEAWTGLMRLRLWTNGGGVYFECGNEHSCCLKFGEFIDSLRLC